MRTTVDLPDELLRRAKATAALRGMKLKDLFAALIDQGLNGEVPSASSSTSTTGRTPLPVFRKASGGGKIRALTNAEIEEIFTLQDAKLAD